MTLDLERDRPAVANIDNAGIFLAGFDQDVRPGRRKFSQLFSRIFIRAMLTPHHGKNSELGKIGFATENCFNAFEFLRSEAVLLDNFRCDGRIDSRAWAGHRHRTLTNLHAGSIAQILKLGRIASLPKQSKYERPLSREDDALAAS